MRIKLTKGKYALIDDGDYPLVKDRKWFYSTAGYACRTDGKKKVYMHRLIAQTPAGLTTDHINGNKLDNRKNNLRNCTLQQNIWHQNWKQDKLSNKTSKYQGVSWHKLSNKWIAYISYNGKRTYLGTFENEIHAAMAWDIWARDLYGKYAHPNFNSSLSS